MLKKFNYKWTGYGENIAKGYITPESVVKEWMTHQLTAPISQTPNSHMSALATQPTPMATLYWTHLYTQK